MNKDAFELADLTPACKALYDDLSTAISKHKETVEPIEALALVASVLGTITAFQDQTKFTSSMIMATIMKNIKYGNQLAIELEKGIKVH